MYSIDATTRFPVHVCSLLTVVCSLSLSLSRNCVTKLPVKVCLATLFDISSVLKSTTRDKSPVACFLLPFLRQAMQRFGPGLIATNIAVVFFVFLTAFEAAHRRSALVAVTFSMVFLLRCGPDKVCLRQRAR